MTDIANNTFDCANIPIPSDKRSSRILFKCPDTCTTAASNAFWQNAELIPSGRMAFSSFRIWGSFLSFFTSWSTMSGFFSNSSMSRLIRAVYEFCICRNTASFSLFGRPYRKTLFVMVVWKELFFFFLAFGIAPPFVSTVLTGVQYTCGWFLLRCPQSFQGSKNDSKAILFTAVGVRLETFRTSLCGILSTRQYDNWCYTCRYVHVLGYIFHIYYII